MPFFFFFSFWTGFWTDCLKLFSKHFMINYQKSLDTLKRLSLKRVPQVVIRHTCGTWHALYTVTSIHSIQNSTTNSQKLGNKLASGWQKFRVDEEFHPAKSRACGYYLKRSLEPKFILFELSLIMFLNSKKIIEFQSS